MSIWRIYLPSSILTATTDLLCHACHNLLIFPVCRDNTRMVNRPGQTFNTYYIQYINNEPNQLNNIISVIQITFVQTLVLFWDSCNLFIIINDFKAFLLTNLLELSFKNKKLYILTSCQDLSKLCIFVIRNAVLFILNINIPHSK